jgi:hypothetical protein
MYFHLLTKEMKFYLPILLTVLLQDNAVNCIPPFKRLAPNIDSFKLACVQVGFGSNMYDMQPVFRANGTKFIYTSEEVWVYPNQTKIQRDTLCIGDLRSSSIDSISNLIEGIKDSVIYRVNTRVMSGGALSINITTNHKEVNFQLHNARESTAEKIVTILNSYIPEGCDKFWIFDFKEK